MPVDHYENFPVASLLLPRRLRRPIEAIYRFARAADDIADEGEASAAIRLQGLAEYRDELDRIERGQAPAGEDFKELAVIVAEWQLPVPLLRDLLDAFAQDVVKKRYADYPELLDYCRRSANPVGRLLLHLAGQASEENLRRSDCICSALQLVNFWQDIAIDWQKDRVYLPQADLRQFDVAETQIAAARWTAEWAEVDAWLAAMTGEFVGAVFDGVPVWQMLVHVMNHGTQHRAEAAALLTAQGRSPGELDMINYAEEIAAT